MITSLSTMKKGKIESTETMSLLDRNFQEMWSREFAFSNFKEDEFSVVEFGRDEEGNIIFMCKPYDSKPEAIKEGVFENGYEAIIAVKLNNAGEEIQSEPFFPKFEYGFPLFIDSKRLEGNKIIYGGFVSEKESIIGTFFFEFSLSTLKSGPLQQNRLPAAIVPAKKDRYTGIELKKSKAGRLFLTLSSFDYDFEMESNTTIYTDFFRDIHVFAHDETGVLDWHKVLPNRQKEVRTEVDNVPSVSHAANVLWLPANVKKMAHAYRAKNSFSTVMMGEKLAIIRNHHPGNLTKEKPFFWDETLAVDRKVSVIANIFDVEGEMEQKTIYQTREEEYFMVKAFNTSPDQILLYNFGSGPTGKFGRSFCTLLIQWVLSAKPDWKLA